GLGYDSQINKSEVVHSVFNSRESDVDDSTLNNRFKIGEGFHAVPPPYTGNYMPSRPDLSFAGLDDSVYKTKVSETETSISKTSKDIIEKPKTVRPGAPIIEDWDTDSDNDSGNPQYTLQDQGIFDSGCSRHMTGNKSFLTDYQEIDGGFVAFGGSPKGGKITGKGKIRTGKLDFEDVYFVKELKFNLFSVSQMCDKKNSVLFTETECLVLSPDFKLLDESQVLLKVPRQNNMYSFDLKNVVPSGGLTCLFAKATIDESNLWHRRLGHINFKTMNKLVRGNLVRGLPSKLFENDHTCVACQKGKQHKASFAKRKNRTLIEAARTMLADSLLPATFWAEAVNTACYVQNRVLVTKPHNKTPYELLHGRPPSISFMRLFGCPVTIFNTLDLLGKFNGKADEGFCIGYSINSKAFMVFNTRTRKVEENLQIAFLENKPNVAGSGPDWLFDIDLLTNSMNYEPVTAWNQTNKNACIKDSTQQYYLLPLLYDSPQSSEDAVAIYAGKKTNEKPINEGERNGQEKEGGASNKEDDQNVQDFRAALDNLLVQQKEGYANNTNRDSTVSPSVSTAGQSFTNADDLPTDPLMPDLEDTANLLNTGIFSGAYDDEDVGAEADLNNLETTMNVSPIPTTRIHKDHPKDQIIGDINSATQTRRMTKISKELAMVSYIKKQRRTNHKDYQNCLFAYFLSQIEPKKVTQALTDPSWIEAMQDELLQNKKDERGIVVRNKASLVAQGYTQEEGIDYDKMDVKSAFLYGTIEEELYVCQPPSFEDPQSPNKVYNVEKALYGLHQAPRSWYETLSTYLLENRFRRWIIDKTLFIKKDKADILQDKYVADILKKFDFVTVKTASTPIETNKALLKDEEAEDVDVHLYRSMIGSLMYLIASRPDIMFAVCACARFQVTPKVSHLYAVKRIFRYLKGQPKLGLWYPRDSPFDLEAFSDSDYAGASLDRKSTTGGCQFLGKRLISWQCKKQTIVANSTTEAEYVAVANCYGISDEFRVKTGSCKVNAARQDLVLLGEKRTEGNADFHQIVDFLNASTIRYSLTISPTIYASYIEQFWATAKSKIVNNETQIHAKVDGKTIVISESSVRSNLYFNDEDGVTSLTIFEILENLALMGYEIVSDKLTFQKSFFSPQWKYPQWKYLIHTILHCLSSKSTSWNEFSTNIAYAVIFLANGQKFKFSKLIFDDIELFASMLAPPVVEGEGSGQPSEPQPSPSTTQTRIKEQIPVTESSSPQNTQSPRQALQEDTQVVRATTTAASLDATQASGNITKTQSTTMSNDPLSQEIGSGGNTPGSDEERLEQDDLTDFVPPTPYDSPLSGGHTPGSDEGRPNINELMAICTNLSNRVLALEQSKTAQDLVIQKLKKKVKRLEKKQRARTPGMKLFKIGTSKRKSLDKEYVSKQGRKSDKTKPMFDDSDFAELDVDNAMENVEGDAETQGRNTAEQITTAGDTVNTASIDVSAAGPSNVSTADPSTSTAGDIFEDEMMTIADTLVAIRSTRPRTTSVVIHDVEEEPRRATPVPINKSFKEIQKLYEKEQKWIKDFIPMDAEEGEKKAASSKKRPTTEPDEESVKRQKIGESPRRVQVKYPIIDWEVYFEDTRRYWRIIRVGNHTEAYHIFVEMLKKFDRDDLVKLWDLVNKRFSTTEPTDDKEKELWVELKRLFEPDNDDIWNFLKIYA
ncbi:putative ribonuclease H-like domain-containing protein, partial [Tanacetum coccineum]